VTTPHYEVPTWNQVYMMLLNQAEKILGSAFKLDVMVGVARGGLVPARILSDLLENSNLATVRVESRQTNGEDRMKPVLMQALTMPLAGKKVLIVDDVADTGQSLSMVKEHVLQHDAEEIRVATLYYKPWSTVKPDYYEKETKFWIIFPWDMKENIRRIIEKQGETPPKKIAGLPKQLTTRLLKQMQEQKQCGNT